MLSDKKTKKLAYDALLLACAMIFSYIEAILPINAFIPLPGFKLGLANVIIMLAMYTVGTLDAIFISLIRIFAMGLLFGNPVSIWFSIGGGACSLLVLVILKHTAYSKFSFVGISVLSAGAHNFGQVIAATVIFGYRIIFSYLPLLLLVSVFYGGLCGVVVNALFPKIKNVTVR